MRLLQVGLRRLGFTIAGLLSLFVIAQIIMRIMHRFNPRPMPMRMARTLRSSVRHKLFGIPEQAVECAGVTPGMRVLEIGPGPGNFTVALARCVGSQGKQGSVTCVEIQPGMIQMLRQHLSAERINNVEVLQGDAQVVSLLPESFDMVFLAAVVGEAPDAQALFCKCMQVLKPGGILAVTEQVTNPSFRLPGSVQKLAITAGLHDPGYIAGPWWNYTARYRKPAAIPSLKHAV